MTREEAIQWLKNEKWKNANNKYKKEWNEAFDMAIEALQTDELLTHEQAWADIDGRPYGEWIKRGTKITCSNCKSGWSTSFDTIIVGMKYCPNCGADMRGVNNG